MIRVGSTGNMERDVQETETTLKQAIEHDIFMHTYTCIRTSYKRFKVWKIMGNR